MWIGDKHPLALLCKPGFETDAVSEVTAVFGPVVSSESGSGFVTLRCDALSGKILQCVREGQVLPDDFRLIFVTDLFAGQRVAFAPGVRDRLDPILKALEPLLERCSSRGPLSVRVTCPESTEVAGLPKFCTGFQNVLTAALRKRKDLRIVNPHEDTRDETVNEVFVVFFDYSQAYTGLRPRHFGARAHRRGRVARDHDAPSRSGSKLLEAWRFFDLPRHTSAATGQPSAAGSVNQRPLAVDLGAAPGGWSAVLASAGFRVVAIDNGDLDKGLISKSGGAITHLKKDAFHLAPETGAVAGATVLTCDIVERPAQVTDLIFKWIEFSKVTLFVFNLKLPMKKRYEELSRCLAKIREGAQHMGVDFALDAHQLYHDRQEVTVFLRKGNGR